MDDLTQSQGPCAACGSQPCTCQPASSAGAPCPSCGSDPCVCSTDQPGQPVPGGTPPAEAPQAPVTGGAPTTPLAEPEEGIAGQEGVIPPAAADQAVPGVPGEQKVPGTEEAEDTDNP